MGATYVAVNSSFTLAWMPWPSLGGWFLVLFIQTLVAYFVVTILGAGYGIVIIATARRPRFVPVWFFPGLTSNPAAARWYGLAFVIPQVIAWSLAFAFHITSIDLRREPVDAFMFLSGPVAILLAFGVCIFLARRAANRPIKDAILSGFAPSYQILPGLPTGYWWDGENWRSLVNSAPEGALRSPSGHYWWSGGTWIPMPAHGADNGTHTAPRPA